ncbi:NADPH-dependent FMN reductase [uncultured Jatrophihabitans sp.]|uniref:NADPH-dependent FMN reductase n=1 Tax=uncultured Jatrophihabitans sp. TaxID=1610747 RepID=UPI0035C9B48C
MLLQIVIASTRPGRIGAVIGEWFTGVAKEHGGFDVEVTDLKTLDLPFHDEPGHPMSGKYEHQHTKDWSATVARSDAFVFVLPEYNHGFSAPLKNAIDFLHREWAYKPVGFVSYGGVAGGTRAVQGLKEVVTTLRMTPVTEGVVLPMVRGLLDDEGFHPTEPISQSATAVLDELAKVAPALATIRGGAER